MDARATASKPRITLFIQRGGEGARLANERIWKIMRMLHHTFNPFLFQPPLKVYCRGLSAVHLSLPKPTELRDETEHLPDTHILDASTDESKDRVPPMHSISKTVPRFFCRTYRVDFLRIHFD